MTGAILTVRGQVQGVGFRPTVWRLATELGLAGDVCNTAEGVEIRLWGTAPEGFAARLRSELPALARIDALETAALDAPAPDGFRIAESRGGAARAAVTPDAATCAACLAEIRDPFQRRFRYPFANCTDCGPRFSIVESVPYDRAKTSMRAFPMCEACAAEYADPADRRFHAQPVACHTCGPRAWLERLDGGAVSAEAFSMLDDVDAAGGAILGGLHRRGEGAGRGAPGLRRHPGRRGGAAARPQAAPGQGLRADGARSRRHSPPCRGVRGRGHPAGFAGRAHRPPAGRRRAAARAGRAGARPARVHAALHADAPSDAQADRPAGGDDLGQPFGPAAMHRHCGDARAAGGDRGLRAAARPRHREPDRRQRRSRRPRAAADAAPGAGLCARGAAAAAGLRPRGAGAGAGGRAEEHLLPA